MKRHLIAVTTAAAVFAPVGFKTDLTMQGAPQGTLLLSRTTGSPGTLVQVNGLFPSNLRMQQGTLVWGGSQHLTGFLVSPVGTTTMQFWVPTVANGTYSVTATVNNTAVAQTRFTVAGSSVGSPTLTATAQPSATATVQSTAAPVSTPTSTALPTATAPSGVTQADVTVTVDRSTADGVSNLATGVTHDHYSTDSWNDPTAVSSADSLLEQSATYQNQHIYGWGTVNPEPSPGVFDWSSLDDRVNMMRSMHAKMVLTLCCAPDWMTSLGTNTSTYPNLPPTPAHLADFADLVRRIAERYPDVLYYQVWNEFKGMWDDGSNNWDYVGYTNLYNAAYDALKSVNPAIQVGGPYLVIEGTGTNLGDWSQAAPITQRNWTVLNYWLQHKHGADFICLDRSVVDDHDPAAYSRSQLLSFTDEFESIAKQIRAVTSLPIWWSESYFVGDNDWNFQAAGLASMILHEIRGGSSVVLSWAPQGVQGGQFGGNDHALFSDTRFAGGGQPYPYFYAFRDFHQYFGPGTQLYAATSSSPDVEVLASATRTLLINERGTPVTVSVNGSTIALDPYEVTVV